MFAAPVLMMRVTLAFYGRNGQREIETVQTAKAEVERADQEQEETLSGLIDTIASVIDAREPWVLAHSRRVATYAGAIGGHMGLSPADLADLENGGLLQDLGKIGIPEAILNKPGRLTDAEFAVMKTHTAIGEHIVAEVAPPRTVMWIVGEHHERFDRSGYPRGIHGSDISLGGRIVALVGALGAILSNRRYSSATSLEWALEEMDRCSGTHLDPPVVAAPHGGVAERGPGFFAAPAIPRAARACRCKWEDSNADDHQSCQTAGIAG